MYEIYNSLYTHTHTLPHILPFQICDDTNLKTIHTTKQQGLEGRETTNAPHQNEDNHNNKTWQGGAEIKVKVNVTCQRILPLIFGSLLNSKYPNEYYSKFE